MMAITVGVALTPVLGLGALGLYAGINMLIDKAKGIVLYKSRDGRLYVTW